MARKINVKLILELQSSRLSINKIAATRHISKHSVSEVLRIAKEKHIRYPDIQKMDEAQVYQLFFPDKYAVETIFQEPDYPAIHDELKKVGVTLKLLWEEYRDGCKTGEKGAVGYTKFCRGYRDFTIAENLTSHIEHKPGERCEVDWSGPAMHFVDMATGEIFTVYLFVGTLPYSQYSYVEPCLDMKMNSFLKCHIHMYQYFGGVPTRTICDNLKTGVVKHPKDGEVVLTKEYEALGLHYMTAIMPAGVRKPKQKASVEGTVGKIATAIIARLRDREFYSFSELKKAVQEKLDDFNRAPFQKREGSRFKVWQEERKYLQKLPAIPYELSEWVYNRSVNLDYHVVFQKNRYSCPYLYVGKKVDLRITNSFVEIYYKGERITTHQRFPSYVKNQYSTHPEDMPEQFRAISQWDDERILNWAAKIGPSTLKVIHLIFDNVSIKEQGYNPSLSVLRLSKTYTEARLETACELALARGVRSPRYHHLKSILATNQDVCFLEDKGKRHPQENISRGHLRGADYYKENR